MFFIVCLKSKHPFVAFLYHILPVVLSSWNRKQSCFIFTCCLLQSQVSNVEVCQSLDRKCLDTKMGEQCWERLEHGLRFDLMLQGYNVSIWCEKQLVETKIVQATHLNQNVTPGYSYTVTVSVAVRNGPDGVPFKYTFPCEFTRLFHCLIEVSCIWSGLTVM